MKGYKFHNDQERGEAERWLAEHEHELPHEIDGSKLGGNRIVYVGDQGSLARISDRRQGPFGVVEPDDLDERHERNADQRALLMQAIDAEILTKRQKDVVELILDGRGVREIAQILGVQHRTVLDIRNAAIRRISRYVVSSGQKKVQNQRN